MTTLSQIRKNKKQNEQFLENFHSSYSNPTPLSIISKIIKKTNIEIINNTCKENGLNNHEKNELVKTFIKPNYYTPYVVNSETKEVYNN